MLIRVSLAAQVGLELPFFSTSQELRITGLPLLPVYLAFKVYKYFINSNFKDAQGREGVGCCHFATTLLYLLYMCPAPQLSVF